MRVLPQALEIIFEVQIKKSNEQNNKKKNHKLFNFKNKLFNLQNVFFIFPLFGPLLFSNIITFLFRIHFKRFKVL
jgi:hypothetical protein